MSINLLKDKGAALDRQRFTWKDMVGKPISKLDDDAFTRVRVVLMNGIESDSIRTKQTALRMNLPLREKLAQLMRAEQHQETCINWLLGPDHSPLETTIAYEQVAIEVTASIAQLEQDGYQLQSKATAMRCSRISIICIAMRPCWTGWRARTPTTSRRATRTSFRAGPRWCIIARPSTN